MKRRITAWIACFMLVFTLTTYHVAEARANAAIIVGVGIGAVVMMMMAAGLTFDSVGAANSAAGDFYGDFPDFESNIRNNTRIIRDAVTGGLKAVVTVTDSMWDTLKGWVDDTFDVGENQMSQGGEYELDSSSTIQLFDNGGQGVLPVTMYYQGGIKYAYITYSNGVVNAINRYVSDDSVVSNNYFGSAEDPITGATISGGPSVYYLNFYKNGVYAGAAGYAGPISVYANNSVVTGTVTGSSDAVDVLDWDWFNTRSGQRELQLPLIQSDTGSLAVGEDLYDADLDAALDGTDIAEATYEDVIDQDVSGIPVVGEVDIPDEGVTDWEGEQEAGSESSTSLKALFFSKFPFCLPWDLMASIKLLAAEPEAPYWEIDLMQPLKSKMTFEGDTKIYIDMGEYPIVGQVARWTSTIGFVICLIVLTRKIIHS